MLSVSMLQLTKEDGNLYLPTMYLCFFYCSKEDLIEVQTCHTNIIQRCDYYVMVTLRLPYTQSVIHSLTLRMRKWLLKWRCTCYVYIPRASIRQTTPISDDQDGTTCSKINHKAVKGPSHNKPPAMESPTRSYSFFKLLVIKTLTLRTPSFFS